NPHIQQKAATSLYRVYASYEKQPTVDDSDDSKTVNRDYDESFAKLNIALSNPNVTKVADNLAVKTALHVYHNPLLDPESLLTKYVSRYQGLTLHTDTTPDSPSNGIIPYQAKVDILDQSEPVRADKTSYRKRFRWLKVRFKRNNEPQLEGWCPDTNLVDTLPGNETVYEVPTGYIAGTSIKKGAAYVNHQKYSPAPVIPNRKTGDFCSETVYTELVVDIRIILDSNRTFLKATDNIYTIDNMQKYTTHCIETGFYILSNRRVILKYKKSEEFQSENGTAYPQDAIMYENGERTEELLPAENDNSSILLSPDGTVYRTDKAH
ncbi:MAG TPA: hypothetical protein PKK43_05455, partial [Spirochaetota bacterium]|nr:hypothetical protein [Spirochaetota bacterium]